MRLKFTQEVKDKWLENLKSGKYVQGYVNLHNKVSNTFCCIGVLGDCIKGLDNNVYEKEEIHKNPYEFLTANGIDVSSIWELNDKQSENQRTTTIYKNDYSNVIPLIESLQVIE